VHEVIEVMGSSVGRRWSGAVVLMVFLAGSPGGCGPVDPPSPPNAIPVFVPLSGPDAARGDTVLKVSTLLNELVEASGTQAGTFRVIDSNLSETEMAVQIGNYRDRPIFVAGGCTETRRIWSYFDQQPPFTLSLFCDMPGERAAIEVQDGQLNRVYWLGPTTTSFVRGLTAYLRDPQPAVGIPPYLGGTFVYPSEQEKALREVVRGFEELSAHGFSVETQAVPLSHITQIADYSATILALRERALQAAPERRFVYLQLPWLSTIEWMRQAAVVLGPEAFEEERRNWFAPLEYLAADPQRSLTPFDISGINLVTTQTATDTANVGRFDAEMQKRFQQGGRGMLTRIAADALMTLALTTARGDPLDADRARARFLEVVTPAWTKKTYTFSSFAAGLKAAAEGDLVDYNGVFGNLDRFDRFGQISTGVQSTIRRPLANGGSPVTVKLDPIFVDPLQGRSLDLARALSRNCLSGESTPGTRPWPADNLSAAFDASPGTGVLETSPLHSRAGIVLHLNTPVDLTGIFAQHFYGFSEVTVTNIVGRIMWWRSAQPASFDYSAVPPDGQADFPTQPKGPWQGVDFSFAPQTVQTIVVLADYADDKITQLFGDMKIFATEAAHQTFCP
jgi:hypothetical protein